MAISQALLPEFDREMANTRKTLERVPDDKLTWKPHPKSGTMLWLASHLANLPLWVVVTMAQDSFDMDPPGGSSFKLPAMNSRAETLAVFDEHVKQARATIAAAADPEFMKPWSLLKGGQTIFTLPKIGVLRSFVMNHLIHHRGQLTVYFRLNDIPVPALYGPSGDEIGF